MSRRRSTPYVCSPPCKQSSSLVSVKLSRKSIILLRVDGVLGTCILMICLLILRIVLRLRYLARTDGTLMMVEEENEEVLRREGLFVL